jgi:hypothetical protein
LLPKPASTADKGVKQMNNYFNSNGNLALSQPPNENFLALALKEKGIDCKGYGVLPKYAMLDPALEADEKGVYAYFRTFGAEIYPSERTIAKMLRISRKRVIAAISGLCGKDYLKKKNRAYTSSLYTLVNTPKKFKKEPKGKEKVYTEAYKKIREGGLCAFGYGKIPSAIFFDGRLEFGSKLIYAFHCAYAGFGKGGERRTFPEVEWICKNLDMCERTYQKYRKKLVKLGYISAVQRHDGGKFSVCDYTLNAAPDILTVDMSLRSLAVGFTDEFDRFVKTGVSTHSVFWRLKPRQKAASSFVKGVKAASEIAENLAGAAAKTAKKVKKAVKPAANPQVKKSSFEETRDILQNNALSGAGRAAALRELKSRIAREMEESGLLRYEYSQNREEMTAAIHYLTDFDLNKNRAEGTFEGEAFKLVNEALIEMCCAKQDMTFRGSCVTYSQVIDKLNGVKTLVRTKGGLAPSWHRVDRLIDVAATNYAQGAELSEIKNPLRYMQAVVWDALQTGDIAVHNAAMRDFGKRKARLGGSNERKVDYERICAEGWLQEVFLTHGEAPSGAPQSSDCWLAWEKRYISNPADKEKLLVIKDPDAVAVQVYNALWRELISLSQAFELSRLPKAEQPDALAALKGSLKK